MLVCHCHAKTDQDIREAARQGARSAADVIRFCRAGDACSGCLPAVQRILEQERRHGAALCARSSTPSA